MSCLLSTVRNVIRGVAVDVTCGVAGIQFLPLDKTTYLKIQCFINMIEAKYPCVNIFARYNSA